MSVNMINVGFGNIVNASRIIAVIDPDSAPIKRLITESRTNNLLIDATYGRKTRAVLIMDTNQIMLVSVQPETIASRIQEDR